MPSMPSMPRVTSALSAADRMSLVDARALTTREPRHAIGRGRRDEARSVRLDG